MMAKLPEVCEILDSQRVPITASDRISGPYPYYGANGVQDYVSDYLFDDELVLLAEDGGNFGSKTKPIAYKVSGKCWVNNHAHVLKPKENIDVDYLCYALMFYDVSALVNGATRQKLTQADMRKMEITLRSPEEQKQIVSQLKKVDELISLRKKQLQKLDDLIKSRFVEMFGDINEYCDVGYYIKALVAGKSLASEEECENKVLKTGAASFDFFDATQVKNLPLDYVPQQEHLVSVGDVIISRMNTTELTGAAAYVWDVPKNIYLPDRLWKAILYNNSNPIFVWQMLIQPSTKEQIMRECSGTSGSMKNISKAGLLAIKVKKVPITMQNQFADFVKQVYKSEIIIQQGLNKLEQMKQALMQKYFE